MTAGLGYRRQRLPHIKPKQRERDGSPEVGPHFELVACRQLLMLAHMAWVR